MQNKTLGMILKNNHCVPELFHCGDAKIRGNVIELNKDIGFDNIRVSNQDVLNVLGQFIDCIMIRNNNHKRLLKL